MAETELSIRERKYIKSLIPELDEIHDKIISFQPDFISILFDHKNLVPVASICLRDCISILYNAKYALYWAHYHNFILSRKEIAIDQMSEISHIKFYADDVALRLYSAGEHLANSIINMFNLSKHDLKPYKKRRTSNAIIIGNYLQENEPNNKITVAVNRIVQLHEWHETIRYRDKWVHEQPPQINGQGIIYKRKIRWQFNGKETRPGVKVRSLDIGGSDKPDILIENLLLYVTTSFSALVKLLTEVIDYYQDILTNYGFKLNGKSIQINLPTKRING